MSYKEEIMIMLDKEVYTAQESVLIVFKKALLDARRTGQSLESIVYEILEGIESHTKSDELLIQSIDLFIQVFLQNTKDTILHSYRNYKMTQRVHKDNIDKQYAFADEIFDTLSHYAKDNQHPELLCRCNSKKMTLVEKMHQLCKEVRYNHTLDTQIY